MEKRRILVIEDDPDILEILEYNLAHDGFEVGCAANGERGLQEAASNKPALVMLSLMPP
jgi:DNA-binding response OmpR family regulator